MRTHVLTYVLLVAFGVTDPLRAEQLDGVRSPTPPVVGFPNVVVPIPTIDYAHIFPETESSTAGVLPTDTLLGVIATWLVEHFDLPAAHEPPLVELVSLAKIAAIRYPGFLQRQPQDADDRAMLDAGRETLAAYDDATQTIYLPEGWNGGSATDLSVLVHEVVHHLQNRGRLKYQCPQEREKVAYAAQQRWLGLFGRTLSDEFAIDPFTILVKTNCLG